MEECGVLNAQEDGRKNLSEILMDVARPEEEEKMHDDSQDMAAAASSDGGAEKLDIDQ